MKKKLSRQIYLLSTGLALCTSMKVSAMQSPQPRCESISLEVVILGGMFISPNLLWNPMENIAYKVTFNTGGTSELHRNGMSFKNVPSSGFDFVGQVETVEFTKLCQMVRNPRFDNLNREYAPPSNILVFDGAEMTVTITGDQAPKTIYARLPYDPTELRDFRQAISTLADRIEWKNKP